MPEGKTTTKAQCAVVILDILDLHYSYMLGHFFHILFFND